MSDRFAVDTHGLIVRGHTLTPGLSADAPAVAILHGFTGCADAMAPLVDRLPAYRRIVPDLVGHGATGTPVDASRATIEAAADQVAAVIADQRADGQPVAVVGYSMGARVALTLAVRRPELIARLALIGGRAGIVDPEARAERVAADHALATRIEQQGIAWFVDHWQALPLFASLERLGVDGLAASRRQRLTCDPTGLALSLRHMGAGSMPPLHGRLAEITVPTLVMAGAEDERYVAIAHELAADLPNSSVGIVADAGHAAHLENPDDVAAAIDTFLRTPT